MSVYLDFNATMPILPEVRCGLLDILNGPMNSSATHSDGRRARSLVEKARIKLRQALDVPEDYRVIFTSTGTEANNLAINGMRHSVDKVFTSNIEHSSVLQTVGE